MAAASPLTIARTQTRIGDRLGFAYFDGVLFAAAFGLIAFSVFTLAMATSDDIPGEPLYFVIRQALYAVVGVALMLAVAKIDYSRFREIRVGVYSLMIAAISLVLVFGAAARGSRRWIERTRRGTPVQQTIRMLALGLAPAALIFLQPDLGTGIVLVVITLAVLFLAGLKWSHFAAIGGVAAFVVTFTLVIAPATGLPGPLHGYQQDRLTAFLNPSNDPGDASYQVRQSEIAIGSGGRTGRGDSATQTELQFLPERHTDFIFAVIGERFGFLGAAFVLSLYALLIWRMLRILTLSKNLYGTLLAGGIVAMLTFQILINVGMTLGIMPVTGITLPLMSYGGSSVLVTFLAIGLLQSIHSQARLDSRSRAPTPQLR